MYDPLYYEVRRMLDKTLSNGVDAAGAGATIATIGGAVGTMAAVETGTPDGTAAIIITVVSAVAAIALNVYSVIHRSRREAAKEDKQDEAAAVTTWREIVERLDDDVKSLKTDREEQRKALDDCHAAHGRSEESRRQLEAQNLALAARVAALEAKGKV